MHTICAKPHGWLGGVVLTYREPFSCIVRHCFHSKKDHVLIFIPEELLSRSHDAALVASLPLLVAQCAPCQCRHLLQPERHGQTAHRRLSCRLQLDAIFSEISPCSAVRQQGVCGASVPLRPFLACRQPTSRYSDGAAPEDLASQCVVGLYPFNSGRD